MPAQQTFTVIEGQNKRESYRYEELVRRVADEVWKLWQQEQRRQRERRNPARR